MNSTSVVCQLPEIRLPIGHSNIINCVAISSDSKLIATGSDDKTVIIWDAKTGVPLKRMELKAYSIQKIFFTHDNKSLLLIRAFDEMGVISNVYYEIWNIETGQLIKTFPFEGSGLADFSGDGKNILIFGYSPYKMPGSVIDRSRLFLQFKKLSVVNTENNMVMGQYPLLGETALYSDREFMFKFLKQPDWFITVTKEQPSVAYNIFTYKLNLWQVAQTYNLPSFSVSLGERPNLIMAASPFKNWVATASGSTITLWGYEFDGNNRVSRFDSIQSFLFTKGKINEIKFSGENNLLVKSTLYGKHNITTVNVQTKTVQQSFPLEDSLYVKPAGIAPNGQYFIVMKKKDAYQYSYSGILLRKLSNKAKPSYTAFLSTDNKHLLTYHGGPYFEKDYPLVDSMNLMRWALTNPGLKKASMEEIIQSYEKQKASSKQSQEENNMRNDARTWNLEYGKVTMGKKDSIFFLTDSTAAPGRYALLRDRKATGVQDVNKAMANMFKMMESAMKNFFARNDSFYSFDPSRVINNYNRLAADSSSFFNTAYGPLLKFINKASHDTLTCIAIDAEDWIILTKEGYYMSSPGAAKSLSYLVNNKVYLFEQFDLQYNRPDIILSRIGIADSATVKIYRNAYRKRLYALHIDQNRFSKDFSFNAPSAEIMNAQNLPLLTNKNTAEITVRLSDSIQLLERLNIWVNGVPVHGINGISLTGEKLHNYQKQFSIPLCRGNNSIEISVLNDKAVESYREQVQIKSETPVTASPKIYFFGIGIENYADSRYNLRYAAKDIKDLEKAIKNKYPEAITELLLNEKATRGNILALKSKLLKTAVDDKIIISISSHGLLDENADFYIATHDINFSDPAVNGVTYYDLQNLLDSIPARNKLLMIDACHSGETDKQSIAKTDNRNKNTDPGRDDAAGQSRGVIVSGKRADSSQISFEIMQQVFANTGRGSGATIIAAAAGTQSAFEKADLKNGVFTYCILELFKTRQSLLISEMQQYVIKRVPELTSGYQHPVARTENTLADWNMW